MIQSSLKEKSILVDFDGGHYEWHRRDRSVESDVEKRSGVRRAVRAKKNIFLNHDHLLHALRQVVQHARSSSSQMTLPWHPSRRLLLNINFLPHQRKMAECQAALDTLLVQLDQQWNQMKQGAAAALGPLYDPDDYPPLDSIKQGTYIAAKFYPMADETDVRLQADEELVNAIREEVKHNEQQLFADAIYSVWEKLFDLLHSAKSNLDKRSWEGERFRTEWLGHLTDLAPVLRGLNLAEDPRLDNMATQLQDFVKDKSEDKLKQVGRSRADAAKEVDRLYQDVAAVFGPMRAEKEGA